MGKSRLAAELRNRLDARTPFPVTRCPEYSRRVSHGVLLQWLRAWTGIGDL
ncbi:MAG: hypothetical protein QN152_09265 [Armatimonadota bacterium]|nr:hypothetical protein [Armatimonadota bacterium]MDR7427786.1 hypothetical protein [Armatimonadota bacterium]MDR7464026.1 hypothetical protein [Armatimonadota bacterium]MDR7468910.1 hypothetical protein [Armatimonadota bacterium]MDR7474849.1 hypothetical protein [Armatimonadota bacterium]